MILRDTESDQFADDIEKRKSTARRERTASEEESSDPSKSVQGFSQLPRGDGARGGSAAVTPAGDPRRSAGGSTPRGHEHRLGFCAPWARVQNERGISMTHA